MHISAQKIPYLNGVETCDAEAVSDSPRRELVAGRKGRSASGFPPTDAQHVFTAMLAFATLEKGTVGVSGSTGALLSRSLRDLSALVNRSLAEVRLESALQKRERVRIAELVEEVRIAATLEAEAHDVQFAVDPVEFGIVVDADRLMLASALGNLVQNAFKFTRSNSLVSLTTHATADRVVIEIADECGGLGAGDTEELFLPFEQRGGDRTGVGWPFDHPPRG